MAIRQFPTSYLKYQHLKKWFILSSYMYYELQVKHYKGRELYYA